MDPIVTTGIVLLGCAGISVAVRFWPDFRDFINRKIDTFGESIEQDMRGGY